MYIRGFIKLTSLTNYLLPSLSGQGLKFFAKHLLKAIFLAFQCFKLSSEAVFHHSRGIGN